MASRSERIKLLAQAIGADIKKAFADASAALLKAQGIEEYGFNAPAKRLAAGTDLNNLPVKSARYRAQRADNILNLPSEFYTYIFNYEFVLDVITGDPLDYEGYLPNNQTLTVSMFTPAGSSYSNIVVFVRSHNYQGFTPWQRITGKIYGVDIGSDVVGDDLEVNSIKAGNTSPKVAFETVKLDITYDNFKYMPDGVSIAGSYDARGAAGLRPSCAETAILSMTLRIYAPIYSAYNDNNLHFVNAEDKNSNAYYTTVFSGDNVTLIIRTKAHLLESGVIGDPVEIAGDKLFGEGAYAELFVIYKVD